MKSPDLAMLLCLAATAIASTRPNPPTDSLNFGSTYVINNTATGLVLAVTEGLYQLVGQSGEGKGDLAQLAQWMLLNPAKNDGLPGEWQIVNAYTRRIHNGQRSLISDGSSVLVDTINGNFTNFANSTWDIGLSSEKGSKPPVFRILYPKSNKNLVVDQKGNVQLSETSDFATWTFSLIPA